MKKFFEPQSVAIVGVSESSDNLSRRIALNLQEFDFNGIIYLVGQRGGRAFGRRIYKSVSDIPDQVDLAVILIPARVVPEALEECGQKGIQRVVIESAGFSELGPEGKQLEEKIRQIAARYQIRFIGPNCIGVINAYNGLCVTFPGLKNVFQKGGISIITQSGGVGLDYLNMLASESLGLAKFASIGNKLDINECDVLEYFVDDPQTGIICMYLESISDGPRLMDIARRSEKPILLHKSNIGQMAREIAASHTAALGGDDSVVSAALRQVDVVRFSASHTLLNFLKVLPLPPMKGNRLAVLSRSGGHAVIAADACEKAGFELVRFPEPFLREIEKHFRAKVIRLTNPLDLGDLFDYEVYTRIVDETLRLPQVDGMIFLHTYVSAMEREHSRAFLKRLEELSFQHQKPVATCVFTDSEEMSLLRKTLPHPVFTAPEDAVNAMALRRDYTPRALPRPRLPEVSMKKEVIAALLERCLEEKRQPSLLEGFEILRAASVPVAPLRLAASETEALREAAELSSPLVMKLVSPRVSHKSDVGGVLLGLEGAESVRNGYRRLCQVAEKAGIEPPVQVLLQPLLSGGTEMIVGAKRDATFGPVVLVGAGGIFVEVLRDVELRVVPCAEEEWEKMVKGLRVYPVLCGARGRRPRDLSSLFHTLKAVARLVGEFPQIAELDVNPLLLFPEGQGALAVDARLVLRAG